MGYEDLPWGWHRVTGEDRETQLDLFTRSRDELLAKAKVSLDELARWRTKGWLSFDAAELGELAEPLCSEVVFIRNLARSGLSDEQIGQLLSELEPPYSYQPTRTAYSFAFGWVQPPPVLDYREVDEFVQLHLQKWIDDKVLSGDVEMLKQLLSKLFQAVAKARTASGDDSESE